MRDLLPFLCMGLVPVCISILIAVPWLAGMWKVFEKAGQPGWAAIVPFYNLYILTMEIAKKEVLWFIVYVFLAPVGGVIVGMEVAKRFGRSDGFGIGLGLLPFVFYPMLGFSDARYDNNPPAHGGGQQNW
jgi:hypothetical protein